MKRHHQLLLALAAAAAALALFFWPHNAAANPLSTRHNADASAAAAGTAAVTPPALQHGTPPPVSVSSATDFFARCEKTMHASISVSASVPRYVVNNQLSTRVLNTRATYGSSTHPVMGMTASRTRAEISLDGATLSDPGHARECIAPRIDVALSFQPLDVYVAREFPPLSCAYREVLAHEMAHVKIYTEQLARIERLVNQQLLLRYDGHPIYADAGKGLATLQDQIDDWLRPLIQQELAQVERLQAQLDNQAETERLSHACLGEVAAMMGSSF